ncbi:MAG: hypothetical protein Q7T55_11180 [Solirubrobacteraceae bacterium]|nr:hypothetical protein [Solirubrobacteraceae bacterium]
MGFEEIPVFTQAATVEYFSKWGEISVPDARQRSACACQGCVEQFQVRQLRLKFMQHMMREMSAHLR